MRVDNISQYRKEIDGLRAFAVIVVIVNHFNEKLLPSGYLGVDIFFVISGYVITSSLLNRKNCNFLDFISSFYARRIQRIIPSLVLFVLSISIFICFFNPDPTFSLKTGFFSLFGLSNFFLQKNSINYFSQSTDLNVFTHTWSLGVEEQFYIFFPFIVWFSVFGKKFNKNNNFKNLSTIITFLIFLSLILFVYFHNIDPSTAFFFMPTRFWEIGLGSLLLIFTRQKGLIFKKAEKIPPILIISPIVVLMFLPPNLIVFSTISTVFLTTLLLICLKEGTLVFEILTKKEIIHIGLISYPLYLWHWGIISISRWTIGIFWWTIPFQIGLIYLISFFSHRLIENPFRRNILSISKLKIILRGFAAIFFSSIFIFFLNIPFINLYLGKSKKEINKWDFDKQPIHKKINPKNCHGRNSFTNNDIDRLFQKCLVINKKNKDNNSVAFVGDSHARTLMSSYQDIYNQNLNIIHYSFAGCPFPYLLYGVSQKKCNYFSKLSTQKILANLKEGDFIVINNYSMSHLGDESLRDTRHNFYDSNGNTPKDENIKLDIYIASLKQFLVKANEKNIKIIFIGSGLRNNLLEISSKEWFRPFTPDWIYREEYNNAQRLNNKLETFMSMNDNIIFFNPLKEIKCCKNNIEFKKFYRDSNHLSNFGASIYLKEIISMILDKK